MCVCIFCFRESSVILFNPGVGDRLQVNNTDNMLSSYDPAENPSGIYLFFLLKFSLHSIFSLHYGYNTSH